MPARSKAVAPPKRSLARRLWRALGWLILAFVAGPIVEVGGVRFVHPPATPLMGIRWLEDRWAGRPPRVLYRWVPWPALPRVFLKAAWVSEDSRFFQHHGFDWIEFDHAMARAERTGGDPRGTSTITMQCARSLFLWQGRSYVRKGIEAYYTVLMEAFLSKRRILELYGNVIEMGPGVYGVEAASRFHYGIPAGRLSADQGAMLAALLPAPRRWNPRHPSPRLAARKARILRELPLSKWPER